MDIRQLTCFLAVAEELSFSRAAKRMHLAQSALSRTIQQLEGEVGAPSVGTAVVERDDGVEARGRRGRRVLREEGDIPGVALPATREDAEGAR